MAGLVPAIHVFRLSAAKVVDARHKAGHDDFIAFAEDRMAEQLQTPSPYVAGLSCRCPRCGKGKLFHGFLTPRPKCEACGLDYSFADAGDGPAIFIILIAGAVVVAAALIVEVLYQPPYWLHALLWGPLILIVTLLPLRLMKSLLIALQYHHKAAEGRLDFRDKP
jgi:uncharacterized protein (DUF983 family)